MVRVLDFAAIHSLALWPWLQLGQSPLPSGRGVPQFRVFPQKGQSNHEWKTLGVAMGRPSPNSIFQELGGIRPTAELPPPPSDSCGPGRQEGHDCLILTAAPAQIELLQLRQPGPGRSPPRTFPFEGCNHDPTVAHWIENWALAGLGVEI